MVTKYFYWDLTSYLGAQDLVGRRSLIKDEWRPNTKKRLKEKATLIYKILENPNYKFLKENISF